MDTEIGDVVVPHKGITHILGSEGTGKTLVALALTRETLLHGDGPVLYVDWLQVLSPRILAFHGIDAGDKRLLTVHPDSQTQGLALAVQAASSGAQLIVLDGLGYPGLVAESGVEIRKAWAEHLPLLAASGIPVLVLQQVRYRARLGEVHLTSEDQPPWVGVPHIKMRLLVDLDVPDTVSYVRRVGREFEQGSFKIRIPGGPS